MLKIIVIAYIFLILIISFASYYSEYERIGKFQAPPNNARVDPIPGIKLIIRKLKLLWNHTKTNISKK